MSRAPEGLTEALAGLFTNPRRARAAAMTSNNPTNISVKHTGVAAVAPSWYHKACISVGEAFIWDKRGVAIGLSRPHTSTITCHNGDGQA